MMKQILAAACAMAMMLTGAAMAETDVRVTALKGPTAMGMAALMNEAESGAVNGNDYAFTIASAVDEVSPKLVKGETDIAAVPANLAAVLYNNTKGQVEVLAVNTLGVLYIVESGESVSSVADLRGRTIYASGKGATPEYALNYILSENGVDPEKDVNIEWKSEHAECLAALLAEENAVAMLPQPFVTTAQTKSDKIQVRLDLTAEWDKVADTQLITGVTVVRKAYAEEHPDVVAAFLADYAQSVNAANTDLDGTAALCEEQGVVAKAAIAKKALPSCNIVCLTGEELKADVSGYLQVLYDADPAAVGGTLPGEDFYWAAQ